jgi:hypothetical protein
MLALLKMFLLDFSSIIPIKFLLLEEDLLGR